MVDGVLPKPLQDLLVGVALAMIPGAILLGWLNNRGRLAHRDGSSGGGLSSDDGPHHHHHGWWSSGSDNGGHHGDSGSDGGH